MSRVQFFTRVNFFAEEENFRRKAIIITKTTNVPTTAPAMVGSSADSVDVADAAFLLVVVVV